MSEARNIRKMLTIQYPWTRIRIVSHIFCDFMLTFNCFFFVCFVLCFVKKGSVKVFPTQTCGKSYVQLKEPGGREGRVETGKRTGSASCCDIPRGEISPPSERSLPNHV